MSKFFLYAWDDYDGICPGDCLAILDSAKEVIDLVVERRDYIFEHHHFEVLVVRQNKFVCLMKKFRVLDDQGSIADAVGNYERKLILCDLLKSSLRRPVHYYGVFLSLGRFEAWDRGRWISYLESEAAKT